MRGYKHFNFAMFRECEEYLMEVGVGVAPIFNPARHDAEVLGMGWEPDETQEVTEAQLHSWMRKDLTEVAASNLVVLLPGWQHSEGARREVQVARWCGVHITEYEPESEYGYRLKPLSADDVDWVLSKPLSAPLDSPGTVTEMKRSVPGLDPECWGRDVIERTDTAQQAFDTMVKAAEARITEDIAAEMWEEYPTVEVPEGVTGLQDFNDDAWALWPEYRAATNEDYARWYPQEDTGEVRSVNPLTGGEKGVKPERFDLVPVEPLKQVARIYGYGAAKYADRNWENGYEWSKSFAALQRHAWAFWGGETIDPESGLPHLASVVFHAMAMMEWASTHPELDDRVKPEALS